MDERDLEPEQTLARLPVDQPSSLRFEVLERGAQVDGLERHVVHPRTAAGEEPADGRVVTGRPHELDAAVADEQRRCLHALLHERLAVLESGFEEALVRVDRVVQVDDGEPDVVDSTHPGDAIRAS